MMAENKNIQEIILKIKEKKSRVKREKTLLKQKVLEFMKMKHNAPIVKYFNDYIILAQDQKDLEAKQNQIRIGKTLGFYEYERVLKNIK